jgi:hypothetical protein
MRRYAPESETERRSTTRPRQCTATSERRCSEVAFDRASRVEIFTHNEQLNDWISVCPTRTRAARCGAPDHVTPPSGAMSFNSESLSRRVPRHPSQSIGRFFVVRCPVSGYRILNVSWCV